MCARSSAFFRSYCVLLTTTLILNLMNSSISCFRFNILGRPSTSATLFTNPCNNEVDILGDFDDSGGPLPCPPNGGVYAPQTPFSAFIGEAFAGTWELEVNDNALQDGGALVSWTLELCGAIDCPPNYVLTGIQSVSNDFETDGTIISDQTINSNVTVDYDSGTFVLLEDNFEVISGVTFHAFIDGCMGAQ